MQKQNMYASKIKKHQYQTVLNLAKKAHKALKCKGVTRADFKFYKNKFYLLKSTLNQE